MRHRKLKRPGKMNVKNTRLKKNKGAASKRILQATRRTQRGLSKGRTSLTSYRSTSLKQSASFISARWKAGQRNAPSSSAKAPRTMGPSSVNMASDELILVTGAAGAIGSRLVRRLLQKGKKVRSLVLPGDPLVRRISNAGCQIAFGDITRPETLASVFTGVHTVYHLAAVLLTEKEELFTKVNVEGTRHVVDVAANSGVKHFIYISSASVVYPRPTPYSLSKYRAEGLVLNNKKMKTTIVRPTLVYGQDGAEEFELFVKHLRKFPIVPMIGNGQAVKRPVHVDDLIGGLATIADNPISYDKLYNLSGGEALSLREIAEIVLHFHEQKRFFLPIPVPICMALGKLLGALIKKPMLVKHTLAGLTQDANLDPSSAHEDLGYEPIEFRRGIFRG